MRREIVLPPYIILTLIFAMYLGSYKNAVVNVPEAAPKTSTSVVVEVETKTLEETTTIEAVEETTEYEPEEDKYSTWYLTAYCPCSKCCGKWAATNTHYDEDGNEYHTGACGKRLIEGYSVAADLPFGTKLYIEGIGEVCVVDRGVSGKHLDLYFENHEDALNFGTGKYRGYIIGG